MSYSIRYFAMSLQSRVYQRLQQEKAFYILLSKSLGYIDFAIFDELDPEEIEEEVRFLIEDKNDRTISNRHQKLLAQDHCISQLRVTRN
ncbi:MAG: hypothetical protein KME10_23390 [Plectolyngbya sp. WJT66-NPBG17]|nr:hypothetical protein [Plectolyngbya sp. WJT66-NPBG17]MBW4524526.1 hypothetical protein [Phormidium tanganyikae FI6-MK23]